MVIRNAINQQKRTQQRLRGETQELQEELVIAKQEMRMLGRRPEPIPDEERKILEEAVVSQIKRRRREPGTATLPVTLKERRATDKANAMDLIKEHSCHLKSWRAILDPLVEGLRSQKFERLKSVDDFIDGFQLLVATSITARQLQQMLKDHGLDVKQPVSQQTPGRFWVQIATGPLDLPHNAPLLRTAIDALRMVGSQTDRAQPEVPHHEGPPTLGKLDVTRDVAGSFYAKGDWKEQHKVIKEALQNEFGAIFRDNGNSFDTCFQFVGTYIVGLLDLRIKLYWKGLALVQSESVTKAVGMNMKGLFYPSIRMRKALRESQNRGLTRIEITYTALNRAGENALLYPLFHHDARQDLDKVERALRKVANICWHISV